MDRLVRALDDLLARGEVDEPVFIQAARFHVLPVLATPLEVIPYGDLVARVRAARVVITHGGPGSIMTAFALGKVPVVVPRDPAYGEHVDGHQLQFCDWLARRRPVTVLRDLNGLAEALRAGPMPPGDLGPLGPSPDVIARLRAIIERGGAT